MKKKSILNIFLMVLFFVLAYLFIDRGLLVKVENFVSYDIKSNVDYKVYLKDNDIYETNKLDEDKKYITSMVDNILLDFNYDILYSDYVNGFYSYSVDTSLVAYEDDINDSLWTKEENIMPNKVIVMDKNNFDNIVINDKVKIDFVKYKKILEDFKNKYDIPVSGYLMVSIKLNLMNEFNKFNKPVEDNKIIKVIIPLSYKTFKIKVINDNNGIFDYSEFSKRNNVNYILVIIGVFFGSSGLSLLIVIIKEMIELSRSESKYTKELKKILKDYGKIIINVKQFYKDKKYNLIYVDSFSELMEVYNNKQTLISFKEIKKNKEAVFLIIDGDDAWIYLLKADILKKDKALN